MTWGQFGPCAGMLRVMFTLATPLFEGPLDVLLGMIDRRDIDPSGIAVAEVVRQYAGYRIAGSGDARETAEFVAMASRLLLIKSRSLLPRPPLPPPIEEEPVDLESILAEYRCFKAAAGALRERRDAGLCSFPRLASPPAFPPGTGLSNVTLQRLTAIVQDILARQPVPAQGVIVRDALTVGEMVERLSHRLVTEGRVSFTAFIAASRSRLEVVVAFMAVLEVIRRGWVTAEQTVNFGDICLQRREPAVVAL
jgi:segregation and condensation protein A